MYTDFHGECLYDDKIESKKCVDEILRTYFPDYNFKGVFFDVGAFEPIRISNSYHFEKNEWECYCFEANTDNVPLLQSLRKNVYNFAISNEDKDEVTFNIVTSTGWTAGFSAIEISEAYKQKFGWNDFPIKQIKVPQKTLNTILINDLPNINKIDILSIDIEGGELQCLQGLDLKKYNPSVIILENATEDKTIQLYLESFGYILDRTCSYNQFYISHTFSK